MRRVHRTIAALGGLLALGLPAATAADPAYESPRSPSGLAPHGQLMRDARAHAEALVLAERQRRVVLRSPVREDQRDRWRTAFRDMSRPEAVALARQTFRPMIEAPAAGPLHSGNVADEYVNPHLARLDGAAPGGRPAVVTSSTPLQDQDASGELTPVDVTLGATPGGWAPANPIEPYQIARSSTDGVSFTNGLGVAPTGEPITGRSEGETIFYANTQTDTDAFVKPLTQGVEIYWQLRSQASPEALRLDVDVPAGASLAGATADGVRVMRDGRTIGFVGAPFAVDAEGMPVKTTMRVDGSAVVVDVTHRDADVAYPIAVDPTVVAGFYFPYQGLDAFNYWGRYVTGRFDVWGGDGNWGRGLNIVSQNYSLPEWISYNPGDEAGMYWTAPGNAKIFKVVNTQSRHITGESHAMCMLVGIANANINDWDGPKDVAWGEGCGPFAEFAWTRTTNTPSAGNTFLFGAYRYSSIGTAFWQYFRDAEIYMIDDDAPGIASLGTPDGWTNGSGGAAVNVLAGDYSTGIKNINVLGPSGWNGAGAFTNPNCHYGPCSKQFSVNRPIGNMPEGTHTITVTAVDPAGNASSLQTRTVSVDHTPPQLDLRGFLLDARGVMFDGVPYDIRATVADQRSRPRRVELRVDGQTVDALDCPDAPTCTASLEYQPTSTDVGDHALTVVASDHAGNVRTSPPIEATVYVERAPALSEGDMPVEDPGPLPTPPTDVTDGDDPRGYCGPGSIVPDQPCQQPMPDSSSDAAVKAEASLAAGVESPLIVGEPDGYAPGAAPRTDPLRRNGRGWGMSDQKPNVFTTLAPGSSSERALDDLSIERVRYVVGWDTVLRAIDAELGNGPRSYERGYATPCASQPATVSVPPTAAPLARFEEWFNAAIDAGKEPVISFEHTYGEDGTRRDPQGNLIPLDPARCAYPTPEQYRTAISAFLDRYNQFYRNQGTPRLLTAWNEPNWWDDQPTSGRAEGARRAAEYYKKLNSLCHADVDDRDYDCTVIAGDFLDRIGTSIADGDVISYAEEYKRALGYSASNPPVVWALHPYQMSLRSLSGAEQAYARIRKSLIGNGTGRIWFTEAGGFMRWPDDGDLNAGEDAQLGRLCRMIHIARVNDEVKRFFQNQLRGTDAAGEGFDTALMYGNGFERRSYHTYRYYSAGRGNAQCEPMPQHEEP